MIFVADLEAFMIRWTCIWPKENIAIANFQDQLIVSKSNNCLNLFSKNSLIALCNGIHENLRVVNFETKFFVAVNKKICFLRTFYDTKNFVELKYRLRVNEGLDIITNLHLIQRRHLKTNRETNNEHGNQTIQFEHFTDSYRTWVKSTPLWENDNVKTDQERQWELIGRKKNPENDEF